ncbi:MAG: TolC family protein [Flavobacteriales bacterium]
MKHLYKLITFAFCFPFLGITQEKMAIEDAIALALKNNYDIQLASNSMLQADNSRSIYNSGYLPTLTGTGSASYANNDNKLTNQAGVELDVPGVEATRYSGSVALNYVVYNGGSRKYNFEKLKNQYELASSQKKIQIENTLIDVYTTFYNVARNQEQKNTLVEAYNISKERLERVTAQQKYGQKTTLDILNAKVDANADSILLLNLSVQLQNNMRNLNFLLGREINTTFQVAKEVNLDENLSYSTLLEQLKAENNQLKQIQIKQAISEQDLKINRAGWLPSVSTSLGYGLNYADNGPAGFFAVQQSNGFNAALNLNWNIFDGGTTKVRVQNAKIAMKTQDLNAKKLSLTLENQLATFWAEYNTQKIIIKNEETNVEISNQNFLKSKELFNLGKVTSIEYRQAQLNLVNNKLNLLNATYNAKIAELQLKRFAGLLN